MPYCTSIAIRHKNSEPLYKSRSFTDGMRVIRVAIASPDLANVELPFCGVSGLQDALHWCLCQLWAMMEVGEHVRIGFGEYRSENDVGADEGRRNYRAWAVAMLLVVAMVGCVGMQVQVCLPSYLLTLIPNTAMVLVLHFESPCSLRVQVYEGLNSRESKRRGQMIRVWEKILLSLSVWCCDCTAKRVIFLKRLKHSPRTATAQVNRPQRRSIMCGASCTLVFTATNTVVSRYEQCITSI